VTTLREHIDRLDLQTWAALTRRTAQAAVQAAQQAGRPAPAHLAKVAAMSEAELIDNYRTNAGQGTRRLPTLRQRLNEANYQRQVARQAKARAVQDKEDAISDARAARVEAASAAAAAEEARETARTARDELARKELERTVQSRTHQQQLEDLRTQLAKAEADTTAAHANAAESAKVAEAAREREAAALDKFAKQAAQLAGEQRQVQTALDEALSTIGSLRTQLERERAESATQLAAVTERANAAEQRAQERLAERTADREEAEREMGRLRAEIERTRSDAEAEIASAKQRALDANNEAHTRMTERAADRTAAAETIGRLQSHLAEARNTASEQVTEAREQAALAIAAAGQNMDARIEKVRAEARREVSDANAQVATAHELLADTRRQLEAAEGARQHAEAAAAALRADPETRKQAADQGLTVPVPSAEIRPAALRIEHALAVLHQVDYMIAVRMAAHLPGERPGDIGDLRDVARAAQTELGELSQELRELPARLINQEDRAAAATHYAHAARAACRGILLRIAANAEDLQEHGRANEALAPVIEMLYRPEVHDFVPEWRTTQPSPTQR
jgi:colicin import membrane protein